MKIGYDSNRNGDILDAGDVIQVSDDFNSNVMTLTYDNNGNLTGDGVHQYVYDGWNRLRNVQRVADGDTTTIGTYAYWPDNRRTSKTVEHCGIEQVASDGGDTVACFYYSNTWQILETRNGLSQATRQWVWGTRYVDEVLFMDPVPILIAPLLLIKRQPLVEEDVAHAGGREHAAKLPAAADTINSSSGPGLKPSRTQ